MSTLASKIWRGGSIRTMDEALSVAQAMAADAAGKLLCVGSEEEVMALAGPDTQIIDLKGAWVVPGLIEGHGHLPVYGSSLLTLPIRDVSKEGILQLVAEAAAKAEPGTWIVGGMGWNNEVWADPTYPTLAELDAVSPANPVMLPRMDGHLIWANTLAYRAAGVDDSTPNPVGGEFMRTADGKLQGCASNKAAQMVRDMIPAPTAEERKKALLAAQERLLKFGVTTFTDMGTDLTLMEDVKALYESGEYKIRFYGCIRDALKDDALPEEKAFIEAGPRIGLYNDHFTVRAAKLLGDGAVGAQSAHLNQPFSDRPGHCGTGMFTDEELTKQVRRAADHGFQMTIHSIGDYTVEQVLRVYKKVLEERPAFDHRWRVEHFQTVTSDTPQQAAAIGAIPSMQPMHAPNSAGMAIRRLGEERIHGAYAAGLVLRGTGIVAFGSDCPVATPSPLSGIHAAVTRTNDSLLPEGGFCMENAVTPLEALKGYTTWGAYTQFAEKVRGSLEAGKCADFVVMDRDVLAVAETDPHAVLKIKVLQTVIDGEAVYTAE